jgi:hypothetical protein
MQRIATAEGRGWHYCDGNEQSESQSREFARMEESGKEDGMDILTDHSEPKNSIRDN